jgi:hypothetical protein
MTTSNKLPTMTMPTGRPRLPMPISSSSKKQVQVNACGGNRINLRLGPAHHKLLDGLKEFLELSIGMNASYSVILRRALQLYLVFLTERVVGVLEQKEQGVIDPQDYLAKLGEALFSERQALLIAAGREDLPL